MTNGKRFMFHGLSASDRERVLRKEIELIALENIGHREVITQLERVLEMAALQPAAARAVMQEIAWRRRTVKEGREARKRKQDSISHMRAIQARAQQRVGQQQESNSMSQNPKTQALRDDVEAARARVHKQLSDDADHLVALAMFDADFKRASARLSAHLAQRPTLAVVDRDAQELQAA